MAEIDPRRLDVACANHRNARPVLGDLRLTVPEVIRVWRDAESGVPDLLCACPPCQGMSSARSDRGQEDDPDAGSRDGRNLLVEPIAEIAFSLQPRLLVIENVRAFLTRRVRHPDTEEPITAAQLLMDRLGSRYTCFPLLADLADWGVPQTRVRSFLTFVRREGPYVEALRELAAAPYPVPTHAEDFGGRPISLRMALSRMRLPSLDARSRATAHDEERPLHAVPVWDERRYRMVEAIPPGSGMNAWDNDECPNCGGKDIEQDVAACPECDAVLNRPVVDGPEGPRLVSGFRASSYRRMDPARPAATVTTASGNLGSDRTVHPTENRLLSPLECAGLQTIPRNFRWGNADEYGVSLLRTMIGEAVPPRFTEAHARVLAGLLAGQRQENLLAESDLRVRRAATKLRVRGVPAG